jgi:hypothetical protein
MLRALGIEAQPALVNTRMTRGLDQYEPGPGMFDHAIVHARVGGREFWLDPTRSEQKGTLDHLSQASFGQALVVDAATAGLAAMPDRSAGVHRHDVHTVFDATGGRGKPVGMQVTTVYEGESADTMRDDLAGQSRDELQRRYLNFYAGFYPDVAVQKPFTVRDDDADNRLTVSEFYVIGDHWKRNDDKKRWTFSVDSPEIDSLLRAPDRRVRTGPLALKYPLAVTSVTEVRLHKDWTLHIQPVAVEDPAFKYRFDSDATGPVVTMTERLDMLADHVQPDGVAGYVAHVRQVRDSLGLSLFMPDAAPAKPAGGGMNWPVAMLALFIAGGAAWLVRRGWRWDPPPRPAAAGAPRGLRGWLILPTLAVVFSPLRMLKDIVDLVPSYSASTWADLTVSGGAHYDPLWAPYLLGEMAANILLAAFSLLLAALFFRRRSSLPGAYVAFLVVSLAVRGLDLVLASMLHVDTTSVTAAEWVAWGRELFSAAIWSSYFMTSKRVAATFVERLHPRALAASAAPIEAGDPVPSVL